MHAALLLAVSLLGSSARAQTLDYVFDDDSFVVETQKPKFEPLILLAPKDVDALACDPMVIEGFKRLWRESFSGYEYYEAALRVDQVDGKRSVWHAPKTYEDHKTHLTIVRETIAIAHTHPNDGGAQPSETDQKSPVPNFVVSIRALWVTDPATGRIRKLRDDWRKPCRS